MITNSYLSGSKPETTAQDRRAIARRSTTQRKRWVVLEVSRKLQYKTDARQRSSRKATCAHAGNAR